MPFKDNKKPTKRKLNKSSTSIRKKLRVAPNFSKEEQDDSETSVYNSLSRSQININSESIPTINDSLTVANITKAKNFLFRLGVAQSLDRYKLFGENARKSIDIIFNAREDKLDHTTLDRDRFFSILLEALHPAFVEPDADFMKLAESVSWKLDLLKHGGLDLQEKLNEIPGWKTKWNLMDLTKRKKAMIYIFKQIAIELKNIWGQEDVVYVRILRDKMTQNTAYDMEQFLIHAYQACNQWKEIRSFCSPPTVEEIEFFGFN